MKKGPLNMLSSIMTGTELNQPMNNEPCNCGEEMTPNFEAQRINEIDQRILNPMETTMRGNIQPGAYNATGFSNAMVNNANQIFNTSEERNKII